MIDEIIVKVKADLDGFSADMQEAKKIGNSAIQDIEKNDIFAKANANAKDLKKSLELIAKASGNIKLDNFNVEEIVNDTQKLKKLIELLSQSLKGMKQGTTEFNSLEAIIKSANVQLQALNITTEKTGKSLKTQMREAQQEVAELSAKFGATSKQAIEAAKRAADLKDTIGDAKSLTDAFNPYAKFNALTSSISGLASGFTAVQGAMGLIGVESSKVEETILQVQSAMALSEGLQGLGEAKDSFIQLKAVAINTFKGIRTAIGSTGIGLLVVALGTIVAYWDDIKGAISGVGSEQKKLNENSKADLDAAKEKLKTLNDQDNVLKLQGKSEEQVRQIKIDALNLAIQKAKIDLQNTIATVRAQVEAEKRNKEILKGLLQFISSPLYVLLNTVDLIGKALGKNFGLAEGLKEFTSNLIFDPTKTALEGAETIKEATRQLKELDNTRAGLILQNKNKEIEASREVKQAREKDFKEYSNTVKTGTEQQIETEKDYADFEARLDKEEEERAKDIFDQWKLQAEEKAKIEKELVDKQKQAVNELLDFAQNGILLQIGLNPQDVSNLRNSLVNLNEQLKDGLQPKDWGAIAQTAQAAYQTVSNAIFNADSQRRQEEMANLQTQRDEEIRLAGDNEQKKEIIRQKYALKEKDIKRKQAEADKRKALFDAFINTAVATITGFVKGGPILAAIAAALGAAQIALIAATPIPKFAKGVVSFDGKGGLVKGEGTGTSDSNLAYLSKGESVIPAAPTSANLGLINELVNGDVDTYINRHYVMPALQAKESKAAQNYRHSVIEAENNLIARVSSSTLKSIDRRLVETNQSIKGLAKKDYTW